MDWQAIALTARLSASAAALLFFIGLPLAHWLATTKVRWRVFVEAIVALPLVLPPTVIGFYILVALGPKSPVGKFWESRFDSQLPFSFSGLLIASVLYSLPFAVQPFTAALRGVDKNLIEAAQSIGASPLRAFWEITIPLCWPGILAGLVLSFAHTVGEFGVVLMVGGNIPGETRTVSISIYDSVQSFDYENAARTSLFLLVVSFAILSVVYSLQKQLRLGIGEQSKSSK